MLGQHLDVGEYGHEVRVAAPARDDVEVDVVDDSGACDSTEVPAEVVALRHVCRAERRERLRCEAVHLERFGVHERGELADVAVRRDQQVPRAVRELVQQDERTLAAMHDEPLLVVVGGGG